MTGGGEVTRYLGRHGESRAAKAALISAVPPLMVKTEANPLGLPKAVFDDLQAQLAVLSRRANRTVLWVQPAGREILRGGHRKLVAPGHDGERAKAHYDGHRGLLPERPDRSLCRLRAAICEVIEERDPEDLQGFPACPLRTRIQSTPTCSRSSSSEQTAHCYTSAMSGLYYFVLIAVGASVGLIAAIVLFPLSRRKLASVDQKNTTLVAFCTASPFVGLVWLASVLFIHVKISNSLAHQDSGMSGDPYVTLPERVCAGKREHLRQ
jgi:hypothetical protein